MGKFDGVLLVSDFDGTLCDDKSVIPQENLRALEYFYAQGGRFTVATGRTPVTFGKYAKPLGINAPAILFNGAVLYDFEADKLLKHATLPPDTPEVLAALCAEMPELGFEAHCQDKLYVFRPNWVTDYHMGIIGGSMTYTPCEIDEMPQPWTKAIVQQEHEMLLRARAWLEAHYAGRYELVFSDPLYLEVIPKGCTKGGAVRWLAETLGIGTEHVYCVGDSQNDLSMLRVSAVPLAPADCSDEVKDVGAHLLRPCGEGTVADAVAFLDKRY